MITNVRRVESSGDIQRYVRYTIAPEKDKNNKHYIHGERTLSIESDYIDVGLDVERNRTSHEVADQLMQWNEEKRAGKKPPASPAMAGVISFSSSDTAKFMSTDKDGNEYLDHQKIIKVAREAVGETMGYYRPMYFALHGDKKHLHVHFVASMVDSHGKIWDGSTMTNEEGKKVKVRDFRQWEITNEKLEIKHGLERVTHRKAMEHKGEHRQSQIKRPSNAVVHLASKGEIAPSLDLAGRLELAYTQCNKRFDRFIELTEQYGIMVKPNMSASKVNGLSFSIDGMDSFTKASELGNRYKWTKLQKELNYEHERDFTKLAELKDRASTTRESNIGTIISVEEIERLSRISTGIDEAAASFRLATNIRPAAIDNEEIGQVNSPEHKSPTAFDSTSLQKSSSINEHRKYSNLESDTVPNTGPQFEPTKSTKLNDSKNGAVEQKRRNEQSVVAVDSQETEVASRRERTLRSFMSKGFTREQSVEMFDQEQARHQKLVVQSEKPHAETWTPDKGLNERLAAASSKNEPDDSMDDPAGRLKQASKNAGYDYESGTGKFLKQKGYNSETGKPEKGKGGSGSGNDDCNCQ